MRTKGYDLIAVDECLGDELSEMTLTEIEGMIRGPARSVSKVASKSQAITLAIQTLAKNLALQAKVRDLTNEIDTLKKKMALFAYACDRITEERIQLKAKYEADAGQ